IRLGHLHRRQHAHGVGDRAAADRHQAGTIRLCRRRRDRRHHAGGFVPDIAVHQPGAEMVAETRRELTMAVAPAAVAAARVRNATTESAPVRWLLIALGLSFIGLVLVLPLISVFLEALRNGLGAFFSSINSDDT